MNPYQFSGEVLGFFPGLRFDHEHPVTQQLMGVLDDELAHKGLPIPDDALYEFVPSSPADYRLKLYGVRTVLGEDDSIDTQRAQFELHADAATVVLAADTQPGENPRIYETGFDDRVVGYMADVAHVRRMIAN